MLAGLDVGTVVLGLSLLWTVGSSAYAFYLKVRNKDLSGGFQNLEQGLISVITAVNTLPSTDPTAIKLKDTVSRISAGYMSNREALTLLVGQVDQFFKDKNFSKTSDQTSPPQLERVMFALKEYKDKMGVNVK